jgi:hypothetical protein
MGVALPPLISLGGAQDKGGGVVPQPSLYVGQVAHRTRMPNAQDTTATKFNSRTHFQLREDMGRIKIVLPYWYWATAGTEGPIFSGAAAFTASIEYPEGTYTQVLFGGVPVGTAAAGSGDDIESDWIDIAIPKDTDAWCNVFGNSPRFPTTVGANNVPSCNVAKGEKMQYGSSVIDRSMGGAYTSTVAGNNGPTYGPIAIVGETRRPSCLLIGNSRVAGCQDAFDASNTLGELNRTLGAFFGCINLGSYGDRVNLFNASSTFRARQKKWVSHVIVELGINNIIAGDSAASVLSALQTTYGRFADKIVFGTTVPPTVGSNNTVVAPTNAVRQAFNAAQRAVPSPLAGVFDISSALEADLTGLYADSSWIHADGIHETQAGYLRIASSGVIDPALITRPNA